MPATKHDEMDVEWSMSSKIKHQREMHNGELMTDTKQLSNIMSDMVKAKVAAQFSLVGLV